MLKILHWLPTARGVKSECLNMAYKVLHYLVSAEVSRPICCTLLPALFIAATLIAFSSLKNNILNC